MDHVKAQSLVAGIWAEAEFIRIKNLLLERAEEGRPEYLERVSDLAVSSGFPDIRLRRKMMRQLAKRLSRAMPKVSGVPMTFVIEEKLCGDPAEWILRRVLCISLPGDTPVLHVMLGQKALPSGLVTIPRGVLARAFLGLRLRGYGLWQKMVLRPA